MSESSVRVEVNDAVGVIVLNRPAKRNAMNWEMLEQLRSAFDRLQQEAAVRVIVIRGEGVIFSAGIDLSALGNLADTSGRPPGVALREKITWIQGLFGTLAAMEKPVIAVLHGMCLGLGLELALAADFRIAAAHTSLGLPEIVLGIIPDCGGSTRLSRLVGAARAKRMILTGEPIAAEEAQRIGLVDDVVPEADLEACWTGLAASLTKRSPLAVGLAKRVIDACHSVPPERQLELESYAQSLLLASPDFGRELAKGMQELMGRAKPQRNAKGRD